MSDSIETQKTRLAEAIGELLDSGRSRDELVSVIDAWAAERDVSPELAVNVLDREMAKRNPPKWMEHPLSRERAEKLGLILEPACPACAEFVYCGTVNAPHAESCPFVHCGVATIGVRQEKFGTVMIRPAGGVKLAFLSDETGKVHALECVDAALDNKTLCGIEDVVVANYNEPPEDAEMCVPCMTAAEAWARGGTTKTARA